MLFKLLKIVGLHVVFREIIQKNKVTILLLHDISKETARMTLSYLKSQYNIIDIELFHDAIIKQDSTLIPKKSLIITFDDGHLRNYDLLEVIKEMNIPITIFLCAGIINTRRHFWFRYKINGMNDFFPHKNS